MTIRAISAAVVSGALLTLAAPASAQETPAAPISPAANVPPPAPVAADRSDVPLLRNIPPPQLAFEGGPGLVTYLGGAAALGPAWNVRVTANFSARWALEGNYVGAANQRQDNDATMVMTELDASVRYNILRGGEAPVQPYVTGGLGYAGFAGTDGDMGAMVVPVSIGVERMLTENIKAGARVTYRPVFFEDLSTPQDRALNKTGPGGDTLGVFAHVGGAF